MNLFIIGNGFDLAHKMKTKYFHFRKFLMDKYSITEDMIMKSYEIPHQYTMPDGDECYDYGEAALAIIKILDITNGTLWQDIENDLGFLDYSTYLDINPREDKKDDEGDDDIKNKYYCNEDNARNLCGALRLVHYFFQEWIKTIQIASKTIKDFQDLVQNDKNIFLNFNYTKTLETLYKVKDVCHIHGTQDTEIFFGHGNEDLDINQLQVQFFCAENEIEDLHNCLKKDVMQAYNKEIKFFKNLYTLSKKNNINIYSYGFSFSRVDLPYLEKIFRNIDTTNSRFYINDFDTEKIRHQYSNKLHECGYKGKISTFHIRLNQN